MVLAGPGLARASGTGPASRRRRSALTVAAVVCALSLAAYVADLQRPGEMLSWYDLNVYNHAGLITRTLPRQLYTWQLTAGIKFTYTPFASLVFAAGSLLPWAVLRWLMTAASLAALGGTVWFTLGALGWRGQRRVTGMLALTAAVLWLEPVHRALHLGQIELLLMVLIVWDLCQPDGRRWKGIGIGLAAGIKLVPLIFIPYLVLAGKLRQAAVAAASFAATVLIGFAVLPQESVKWWLTGYFLRAGNVGDVGSLLNQSVYAMIVRAAGGVKAATPTWLLLAFVIAAVGLTTAAVLHRGGEPVAGWLTCAVTGVLVSPISWDHHWVWVVPTMVVLADAALRRRGARRWGCWLLAAGLVAVYGAWPPRLTGPFALMPQGLLGFFGGSHSDHEKYHLHGLQVVSWNLYVLGGLGLLALAVTAAARRALTAAPAALATAETPATPATSVTPEAPVAAMSGRGDGP
ncbi:MAG TPA: glycosyltransferase 87 family protein [Streptosporangiaceae bacterium]|nr:glycosyltransferase 87 family protein [Streptosporangiaceae bacterium]